MWKKDFRAKAVVDVVSQARGVEGCVAFDAIGRQRQEYRRQASTIHAAKIRGTLRYAPRNL
jgi:hypothetical protein